MGLDESITAQRVRAISLVTMPENEIGHDHDHDHAGEDGANQDGNPLRLLICRTL